MKNLQELSSLAVLGGQPTVTQKLASWPIFDDREREAVGQVLESGAWGGYSPVVKAFEQCFAQAHGCEFGISTANGTLSLEAALIACGVGHGDEVIVPPITFAATATAVLRIGAVPVFSDIERNSFNLDPCRLEEAISERTKAMIPVHFAGHPADLDQIMNIAAKRNLVVLEDCAHAHGASWRGRNVGSIGSLGSFSFQQSKNMTAGEGGILVTNDPVLAEKTWSIANQGRDRSGAWYEHNSLGTNLRMTGFQAAILNVQLDRVPEQIELRQRNAVKLSSALQRSGAFLPPVVAKEATGHAFHLFVVRMREERLKASQKMRWCGRLLRRASLAFPLTHSRSIETACSNRSNGERYHARRPKQCAKSVSGSLTMSCSPMTWLLPRLRAHSRKWPRTGGTFFTTRR